MMTSRMLAIALLALAGLSPALARAQTHPGWEIGAEGYYYAYREPAFVAQTGPTFGVNASYTLKRQQLFLTLNGIGDIGYLNYTSSGTGRIHGIWNYTGDFRALAGSDFAGPFGTILSPYTGLGYRLLFDEAGGRSSTTGAAGYDRLSNYLYLPVGLTLGIPSGAWTLKPNLEFDYLIQGWQISYLSEVGYDNDPVNRQQHGYGLRASFLVETPTRYGRLSVGPFIRYWNIGKSVNATLNAGGQPVATVFEPANNTIEAGATLRLGF
jgi:hypothetical protein